MQWERHPLNSNLEIFNETPEIHDPESLHLPLGQRIIQTYIKEALKCSLIVIQTHQKRPKSLGKTSNLHSLLSQSHQSLMLSRSLLPCGRRGNPYVHIPNNSKSKIKAEVVLQGIDGKRGRDFHEGEEVGEKCAASMSSTTGTAA